MSAPETPRPFLLGPGEGEAFWSLGGCFAIKVGGDLVDGRLALVEASLDRAGEPPLHIHHREDEVFYVVDGQLTFHVDGERLTATSGALAFAPKGIAHAFTVDVEPSRVLVLTSPAGFEAFVRARGVPAVDDHPPAGLAPPDSSEAAAIQERFGIEIIGPPNSDAGLMAIRTRRTARQGGAPIAATPSRIGVRKTYKLYIGGEFPRTESGRSYLVSAADGTPLANACRGSRKDLRDAVRAARKAFPGWAARTAMNRGQVLYRVAELMEGRRDQFVAEVAVAEGLRADRAREVVDRAIDRWVWYAGWADKITQVLGASNPVGAPYFNFTIPEPTGVVGIVAPETSSLLGLVSRLAPPLVAGNATVVLTSEARPLPAVTLAEVLETSDVPGGVVNVITGFRKELVPVLAGHVDVDAIDTWGVPEALRTEVELTAMDNVKRLSRRSTKVREDRFDWLDDRAAERPEWIAAFLEMKTVWHPIGV